jgi:hypothetical protein
MVKFYPWTNKDPEEGKAEGEEPNVAVRMKEADVEMERSFENKEVIPRSFYISAKNLEEHGFSAKCPGCLSILRGKARQAHSAECRKRFENILADTDRVKRANDKIVEYLAKQLERADEERTAKKARREDGIEEMKVANPGAVPLTPPPGRKESQRRPRR